MMMMRQAYRYFMLDGTVQEEINKPVNAAIKIVEFVIAAADRSFLFNYPLADEILLHQMKLARALISISR